MVEQNSLIFKTEEEARDFMQKLALRDDISLGQFWQYFALIKICDEREGNDDEDKKEGKD